MSTIQDLETYETPTHATVAQRVHLSFIRLGYRELDSISVRESRGAIVMQGVVDSYYMKQIAQEVAKHVAGVRHVINNISVRAQNEKHNSSAELLQYQKKRRLSTRNLAKPVAHATSQSSPLKPSNEYVASNPVATLESFCRGNQNVSPAVQRSIPGVLMASADSKIKFKPKPC